MQPPFDPAAECSHLHEGAGVVVFSCLCCYTCPFLDLSLQVFKDKGKRLEAPEEAEGEGLTWLQAAIFK